MPVNKLKLTLTKFFQRIDPQSDGCWTYTGPRDKAGYGTFGGWGYAHRVAYSHFVEPIPPGLHIDHLCRNRSCVNPLHLEAVTNAENVKREAQSRQNYCRRRLHKLEGNNILKRGNSRACRACFNAARRKAAEMKRCGSV